MKKKDKRYWLTRKGRNWAFINKLVTEIGHTSERKVGGHQRKRSLKSQSPPTPSLLRRLAQKARETEY